MVGISKNQSGLYNASLYRTFFFSFLSKHNSEQLPSAQIQFRIFTSREIKGWWKVTGRFPTVLVTFEDSYHSHTTQTRTQIHIGGDSLTQERTHIPYRRALTQEKDSLTSKDRTHFKKRRTHIKENRPHLPLWRRTNTSRGTGLTPQRRGLTHHTWEDSITQERTRTPIRSTGEGDSNRCWLKGKSDISRRVGGSERWVESRGHSVGGTRNNLDSHNRPVQLWPHWAVKNCGLAFGLKYKVKILSPKRNNTVKPEEYLTSSLSLPKTCLECPRAPKQLRVRLFL